MLVWILPIAAALLVAVDQITKYAAVIYLKDQATFPLWPGVFELEYRENTGVAFSMLENQRWIFIPLTLAVMVLLAVLLWRSDWRRYRTFRAAAVLILAGGIGNLIDRIFLGYVVDFLYFKLIDFPIFNFADCCVCVGAALLFVFLLFVYKEPENMTLREVLFGRRPAAGEKAEDGKSGETGESGGTGTEPHV